MADKPDAGFGITPQPPRPKYPFKHIVAGMYLGRMEPTPLVGEFDSVLSVGKEPGKVENLLRHKHSHIPYGPDPDNDQIDECAQWVRNQVQMDRKVLVRSEGGKNRPGLIVACAIVLLGGRTSDAKLCLSRADMWALSDFRYERFLAIYATDFYSTRAHAEKGV